MRRLALLLVAACGASSDGGAIDAATDGDAPITTLDGGAPDARRFDAPPGGAPDARRFDAPPGGAPDAPPGGAPDAPPGGAPDAPPAGGPDANLGACPDPGGLPSGAVAAWQRANSARAQMGVGCAQLVPALATSARLHCEYYAANTGSCISNPHREVMGCTGFVAVTFGERETKAGYTGSPASENMAFGALGASATQLWIDSVWHRTPVLSPWIRDLGHGEATGCATMDFGGGAAMPATTVVMWPYDGQTGVPTSFDGSREGPEPPLPVGASWPSGYPITIYLRGKVTTHTLTVDGESAEIAHVFLTPGADNGTSLLRYEHILYAVQPLAAATRYRVRIVADTATREWTFTTR